MAAPITGTLTGDLTDALGSNPYQGGILWLEPPRVSGHPSGALVTTRKIAVSVAADGTITPTELARTDLGTPSGWAYRCTLDMEMGLGTDPFYIVITKDTQTIAEALVPEGGAERWTVVPASLEIGLVAAGDIPSASITGPAGDQQLNLVLPRGEASTVPGPPGPANVLSIGTVTTGAAGSAANATITGTSPSQILSLWIPRGATGATGLKGDKGDPGPANVLSIGTVTKGTTAAASITGTSPSQTLNLTLPQGDAGPAPTLQIGTVTTLAAGSSATASFSGSNPYALNLGLPKGADGAGAVNSVNTRTGDVTLTGTDIPAATTSAQGAMTAGDKTKLDTLTTATATTSALGYMSAADKTKLNSLITTAATTTAMGYLSAADKVALDATKIVGLQSGGSLNGVGTGIFWASAPVAGSIVGTPGSGPWLVVSYAPSDGSEKWQIAYLQGTPNRIRFRAFNGTSWSVWDEEGATARTEVSIALASGITGYAAYGWNGLHLYTKGGWAHLSGAMEGLTDANRAAILATALSTTLRPATQVQGVRCTVGVDGQISVDANGVQSISANWPLA